MAVKVEKEETSQVGWSLFIFRKIVLNAKCLLTRLKWISGVFSFFGIEFFFVFGAVFRWG